MSNLWRRCLHILFLLLFCLGAASAVQSPVFASPADQETLPALFDDPLITPTAILPLEPAALRARYVQVNFSSLENAALQLEGGAAQIRLSLNLFSNVTLTALLTSVERFDTGYVLNGTVDGVDGSSVTLSASNQTLSASIALPEMLYQVRFVNASHAVYEINYLLALPETEPEAVPPALPEGMVLPLATSDDDGSRIDVLVVYTDLAMAQLGGQSATNAYINQAISDANTAYANSQINQRMHLTLAARISGYDESLYPMSRSTPLPDEIDRCVDQKTIVCGIMNDHLTVSNDGYLDYAHTLRNTVAADLVVLLVQKTGLTCGVGWLMDSGFISSAFSPYGFSVVNVSSSCQSGSLYTVAHETGHNMGAQHNEDDASGPGAYSYSYGHWASDNSFRTVMAYDCPDGCTRIKYFSNPDVFYNGLATGTSNHNNALTLNNTSPTVAKFRDGAAPIAPTYLSAATVSQTEIELTWTDNSDDESAFWIERAPNGSSTWAQIDTVGANQTSYTDSGGSCGNSYRYRVRAHSGNGNSTYSNIVTGSTRNCAPNPPSGLSATTLSTSSIRLNWTDNSDDEDGFVIYSLDDLDEYYADPDMEEETINSLSCGTTYRFQVTAYNAYGESSPSNTVSAATVICPPTPNPFTLTATALSQSRIRLSWEDTAREASYIVERSSNGSTWSQLGTLNPDILEFEDTGLACGTSRYYRVRAVNTGGQAVSNTLQFAPNACDAPPAPTGLDTTPYSAYWMQVSWDDVLDDEESYRIERSFTQTGSYSIIGYTQEDEVVFIDTNAIDLDGEIPTVLWYRIVAINGYGESTSIPVQAKSYSQFFPYMQFIQ